VSRALEEQKRAESDRDRAREQSRIAESAKKMAATRAQELTRAAAAEEERLVSTRKIRAREERAVERARQARMELDKMKGEAAHTMERLTSARSELAKAKDRLAAQESRLRKAEARAERAASDHKVSNREKTRLRREAEALARARDKARTGIDMQSRELNRIKSASKKLIAERDAARRELVVLKNQVERARSERESEEARLGELVAQRQQARSEYSTAQTRKQGALAELARAEAELKAVEKKREKALLAAKKARMATEKSRRPNAASLAKARAKEAQAARELESARAARTKLASSAKTTSNTRVRQVDVVEGKDSSRVVIALSAPGTPKVVKNRGREAILEIPSAEIAGDLERTLDTSHHPGAIRSVSSFRDPKRPGQVKVVVELNEGAKGVLKRVGNTFYWDFPKSVTKVAKRTPAASAKKRARATSYPTQAVASYGAAAAPIAQQTVAQVASRRRKTYSGRKIDLDTRNAEFHALMRLIAEEAGVNIVVPDAIKANVTIRLRKVPWDQALEVILASKGLGYKLEGPKLYRIATRKELDQELEDQINRAKTKAMSEAPKPEVFNLNYVNAGAVSSQISPLLSPKGQATVDERTNAIIINDVSANRKRIINLLTRLDTQTPQIQIEARIVEARTTFVREFGIQWGGNMNASAAGGNATGLIFPSSIGLAGAADDNQTPTSGIAAAPSDFAVNLPAAIGTGSGGGIGLSLGSVGGNVGLNLRLSALEDRGSVRIISAPKITTSNNIQAEIKSGVSIPISVVSANGAQTTFVPADLKLKVKPTVSLRDCAVSMKVEVKKNEADFANTGSRGDPSIITKEAKTTILVDDGETSVIGGIYTRNNAESFSKVPILGDIPVFGWLFKNSRKTDERSEVLVFLTPKITNRDALPCQ
jgi:type IV pilus assembly protein PilQ